MVSFVILHYKNLKDTLECIDSIKKLDSKSYSIVVVDNGTLSEEEKKILKKETNHLICNKENLGFAKANNMGCTYAIKHFEPNFLVVLNNDIVLTQSDFIERIEKSYKDTSFDFMGPKILTNGGESVNPFPAYQTIEEVEQAIDKSKKLIQIYQNTFLTILLECYMRVKRIFVKPRHLENGISSQKDIAVHGCCIVFSKKYYQKYKDVFYPGTFLYHEEEFLECRRSRDGLISYYDASTEVFHKEGASLDTAFEKRNREKLIFRNENMIQSLTLLLEELKKKDMR